MCFKIIPTYGCNHNGKNDPELVMWDTDSCSKKLEGSCPNLRERSENHSASECWKCASFYKHCYGSTICEHEWDHMVTDCDRDPHEPDVILVTPEYELCPACKAAGYEGRPVSEIPKTKSIMPPEFENLPRRSLAPSVGEASTLPGGSVVSATSLRPSASRAPSSIYNPGASRAPTGSTRLPSASRLPAASKHPLSNQAPPSIQTASSTRVVIASHLPTEAPTYSTKALAQQPPQYHYPPSGYPSSSHAPSSKPPTTSTQIYKPVSKGPSSRPQARTEPLTAAELLARGTPKKVTASAFYNNPDGAEARARAVGGSFAPGSPKMPPSHPPTVPSPYPQHSTLESSTRAPPADASSLDLEALMGDISVAPSSRSSKSRTPGLASSVPSSRPVASSLKASGSGNTQYPSIAPSVVPGWVNSRTAAGHSMHPDHLAQGQLSHIASSARPPASSQVPSPRASPLSQVPAAGTHSALPCSKSMAGPKSAILSRPPILKSNAPAAAPKAKVNGRVGAMSAVPEADEDLYRG